MRDGAPARGGRRLGGPVEFATSRLADIGTMRDDHPTKSQGSQATEGDRAAPPRIHWLLTRELLYTAVTRAREKVRVIGTAERLRAAVARRAVRCRARSPVTGDASGLLRRCSRTSLGCPCRVSTSHVRCRRVGGGDRSGSRVEQAQPRAGGGSPQGIWLWPNQHIGVRIALRHSRLPAGRRSQFRG